MGNALPEKIGHYKVVSELGRGGMGVVYKAHEESLNRFVAIKVLGDHLASDEQFLSRFTREARAAGAVSHPNVIPIYFIGQDDGRHYFAMEYVSGRSVQAMIRQEGRIGNPRAAQIILQAAQGLAAAHDKGVIHRDIKPANLMVDERGVVKIADFGIALPIESQTRLTATGALMGTPGYLSPEHCMGETVDHRADIYALGVTYYEMLTGRMPFNAESPLALLRQILQEDPPDVTQLNSEVDAESKRILMKMIARDREQRYQSCHEVVADLEEYLATQNVRSVTANLATRSTAAAGAASTPTVIVGAEEVAAAKTLPPQPIVSPSMAVTAPGDMPMAQPVTQPGQQQQYVPPPAPPKKSGAFALVAAIAVLAFVAAVAAAGVIGFKMWRGGKSFFSASKENTASVMQSANTSAPKTTTPEKVELSNPVPTALETASSSEGQAATPVQSTSTPTQPQTQASTQTHTVLPARSGQAPLLRGTSPTKIAQVAERTPLSQPQPVGRRNNVAVAVQGESALNSAVAEVLTSELSSAGLEVANADDMPATEGIAGSGSSGALVNRLRGHAGVLVIARIEPAGERELHYMGRVDTAYSSRVNVTVYDVASGNPIGTRASGTIEYTSLNASQKAEQVVGPLARKAVEAIQNR